MIYSVNKTSTYLMCEEDIVNSQLKDIDNHGINGHLFEHKLPKSIIFPSTYIDGTFFSNSYLSFGLWFRDDK